MLQISDLTFSPYILSEAIQKRVSDIAQDINQEYEGRNPLFLGILNGSFMFAADLFKHLTIPCEISFLKVNSYQNDASSGKIKNLIGLNESIENRHIVILEDIVDTGLTLDFILQELNTKKPASISVASLLHKPAATRIENPIKYVGFEIENQFVVGYGLDYNGLGRNQKHIYKKVETPKL
jgi:hypoxanthine phosphoribosyltransferase